MNNIKEKAVFRLPETEAEFKELIKYQSEVFGKAEEFYDDLYIEIGHKNTVVAFIDGEIVGSVNFPEIYFPEKDKNHVGGYIFSAWVKEEYRESALWTLLLEKAEEMMAERGYEFILTIPESRDAFGMYESIGYTEKVKNGFPYIASREVLREYNPLDDVYMLWKVYSKTHDVFMKDMELFNHTLYYAEEHGKYFAIAKNGYIVYSPRYDDDIVVWDRMERGSFVDSGKREDKALCKILNEDIKGKELMFNMMFEPEYDIITK